MIVRCRYCFYGPEKHILSIKVRIIPGGGRSINEVHRWSLTELDKKKKRWDVDPTSLDHCTLNQHLHKRKALFENIPLTVTCYWCREIQSSSRYSLTIYYEPIAYQNPDKRKQAKFPRIYCSGCGSFPTYASGSICDLTVRPL